MMPIEVEGTKMKESWYALYTAPRTEKKVAERLTNEGIENYLPLHLTPRKWSDRIKMVETPLFSSYIFVKTKAEALYALLKTPGIVRIVYFNQRPATLRDSEIEAIRKFLSFAAGRECMFEIDDELRIAFGPLKDRTGKIKKLHGKFVVLLIEKTRMEVMVELDKVLR